ncbi:putative membrane protein [Desulfosporosinus sp. OT]|nr:putative membrane protein [Desulfosporosinus sp. OT]
MNLRSKPLDVNQYAVGWGTLALMNAPLLVVLFEKNEDETQ